MELAKTKKVRAGHRASASKTVTQLTLSLEASDIDLARLKQQEGTLKEVLKRLDEEILTAIDEADDIEAEIGQSDEYRKKILMALFQIEEALLRSKKGSAKRSPSTSGSTTPKSPTPPPPPPKSPTPPSPPPPKSPTPPPLFPTVMCTPVHTARVKLPKLNLRSFPLHGPHFGTPFTPPFIVIQI